MKNRFCVKKRTLFVIAGVVWIISGFNVTKIGINAYIMLEKISAIHLTLSVLVFIPFGVMFYKMSLKHSKRINLYKENTRPFWNFFDLKSYLIMTFMMSFGIWLRSSGLASVKFIAVFYTGLGLALALAGVFFTYLYLKFEKNV